MTIQEQLRALVERHLVNLGEELALATDLLTPKSDTGTLPLSQIIEAQEITHKLKGTAGSMGFSDIGASASALDEILKTLKTRPDPITAEQLQPVLELLVKLRGIAENTTPAMSALYNADLSKLAQ